MPRAKINRTEEGKKRRRTKATETRRREIVGAQDIGHPPDVADPDRRIYASSGLRQFCETYFPYEFYLLWSEDHLTVIDNMEICADEGGMFAFAMPRGSGKTTLERACALWITLTGRMNYSCVISGARAGALSLLAGLKTTILSPEMEELRADFPEALFPLWCLEDSPRRTAGQHINGDKTHCVWAKDRIVFPTVRYDNLPGYLQDLGFDSSPSSSSVISATSLESSIRGQQHTRTDGTISRPRFVLLDDPQTRESAKSPAQTKFRIDLINGDVLGLPGPGVKPAIFLTCTVMYENDLADQMLDKILNPQWQGHRMQMIRKFPVNTKEWDTYRKVRENSMREGRRGIDATIYYFDRQAIMDEGGEVSWKERKNPNDVSAIQHAMNLKLDLGDIAFNSEYQNIPASVVDTGEGFASTDVVKSRINGLDKLICPKECEIVTAYIDVHKRILYYVIVGWKPDKAGYILDYGTFPDQARHYFTSSDCPKPMSNLYPNAGEDGVIQSGLEALVREILEKPWGSLAGAEFRIGRLLIDMGYKPSIVAAVKSKNKAAGDTIWMSKGVGIKAGSKPISTYKKQPGWRIGYHWYSPAVARTGEVRHVCADANFWKSYVHASFLATPGDPGALTIFGDDPNDHTLFADHISASEVPTATEGQGRKLLEWKLRTDKPDNHFFDVLAGCCCGASMLGLFDDKLRVQERPRKHFSQSDLRRR